MEQPKNNLKIVTDKKTNARVILPNMLTLIGVCIGLSSIRFALDGKFEFAIIAIMFAALIDGLDGRIARLIKGTSKVGKELDSLTDMISFGVATPKLIMSVKESNSLPTFDVPLINLAILPSKPSIRAANIIAIIANSNFPSNANLIDDKPIQTPIRVSMLGKITLALVFLSVTIFKLFFGCSIN